MDGRQEFAELEHRSRRFVSQGAKFPFILETVFMKRSASAIWVGGLKRGKGVVTTESATLSQSQYFATSHAKRKGTNPYELIAAAHAACFSMELAHTLASAGFYPHRISTTATITMEQLPVDWTVTGIQLDVLAEAPRANQNDFISAAVSAKTNCAISRLFKTNISMSAKLENSETRRTGSVRRRMDSPKVSVTKKQSIGRSSPKAC
jgi:osmotically inducible protein OsmC